MRPFIHMVGAGAVLLLVPWVFAQIGEKFKPTELAIEPLSLRNLDDSPARVVRPGGIYKTYGSYVVQRDGCSADFAKIVELTTASAGLVQEAASHHGSFPIHKRSEAPKVVTRTYRIPHDAVPGTSFRINITGVWNCYWNLPGTAVVYRYPQITVPVVSNGGP